MSIHLDHTKVKSITGEIQITGSKSESNRLLILQKLFPEIQIKNLSNSDDTQVLKKALKSNSNTIDIGHAGTAMRFLTAFLAIQKGKTTLLTGSKRMQKRPIKLLVDALNTLGADIRYTKKEGYPPLQIAGRTLTENKVTIAGNISSQYISALLMIGATLPNGLESELQGNITSIPYIKMTLALLDKTGIKTSFIEKTITIKHPKSQNSKPKTISVEPDWSSASYYYSLVALQPNTKITLKGFIKNSLQGDSILPEIYKKLGVKTSLTKSGIILESLHSTINSKPFTLNFKLFTLDLKNSPDLAQTIAVTCLGLGIDCHLTGLQTLKIKETDRLQALKNELEKLGAIVIITEDSLALKAPDKINSNIEINTYDDHRMAMAFAPLSVKTPININNPEVVSKSYPDFWEDWNTLFTKGEYLI